MRRHVNHWKLGSRILVVAGFGLGALGCSGQIGGPEGNSGKPPNGVGAGSTGAGSTGTGTGTGTGGSATGGGPTGTGGGPGSCTGAPTTIPVFHRLNRNEYQNSVNILLGTNLPLRDDLPVDSLVNGLDNNADTAVSATLMQKYLTTAQKAVEGALASAATKSKLIPCAIDTDANCPRKVIEAFLPQAFRRPVQSAEVDQYLTYMNVCNTDKTAGIGCALQAALISPKFLFRTELLGNGQAAMCSAETPLVSSPQAQLADYELATRLSYFLWSAPPDATLYDLAAKGMLNNPTTLAAQVDRMLTPTTASKFLRPFADNLPIQFLQLDAVASAMPSTKLFPTFDEPLRQAMQDESRLFFAEILQKNLSALELLRTNFTFVNERLAKHYGISGVTGTAMQKVDTTGTARGGLLTQASFLTATSSTENTSIVIRAKWVLTNLLCESIGAPPPGAQDSVPAPDPGLGLTNRESLQIRTGNMPCSNCHQILNPIGFGLEIYDAIGTQRSLDKGKMIDPSGVLPGGATFKTTDELLDLLKHDERFPACFTQKVLTYALGRSMNASCDYDAIQALAKDFKDDGFRVKNHIARIVQSDLFRSARRK